MYYILHYVSTRTVSIPKLCHHLFTRWVVGTYADMVSYDTKDSAQYYSHIHNTMLEAIFKKKKKKNSPLMIGSFFNCYGPRFALPNATQAETLRRQGLQQGVHPQGS